MNTPGGPEASSIDGGLVEPSNNGDHAVPEVATVELLHQTELVRSEGGAAEDINSGDASGDSHENNGERDNGATLPRKVAWIQSIESVADLRSSIFEFVPPEATAASADSSLQAQQPTVVSVEQVPATPESIPRAKKRVSFSPEIENTLAHDHVFLIDASTERSELLSTMEQCRQMERSYVVPDDIPSFGWWDCFQLGLSLTYTTICLRKNISARCLAFDDQQKQRKRKLSSISATQISVLAHAGLAFNCSTRSLTVRQGQPPPQLIPAPAQRKPKRKRRHKLRRLGFISMVVRLRHRKRMKPKSRYKWIAKLSERVPSRAKDKSKKTIKPKPASKPRRPVRLKLKLKINFKFRGKPKSNGSDGLESASVTKIKRVTKGPDKHKIGSYGAIAVFRALRVNRALLTLSLEYVAINDSAMSALAAALRVNTALTHLSLVGNRIGAAGARDLADALEDSPDSMLIDLNLRDNRLGAQGAEELGRALRENETLTRCDFSWNQMGPHAVLGLLSALRDNFALRELCVYGRDLAEDGTHYLANLDYDSAKRIVVALRHVNESFAVARLTGARAMLPIDKMKTSRWIHLADRELVELDGLVIAGLIPRNSMLLSLDLHDNPGLGRAAVLGLLSVIRRCPTLRDVDLSNTGLFPDAGESLGELVVLNSTLETIKLHETVFAVQQLRGNRRAGEVPDMMAFTVASKHFLDFGFSPSVLL